VSLHVLKNKMRRNGDFCESIVDNYVPRHLKTRFRYLPKFLTLF
jgi:hypothetical protein